MKNIKKMLLIICCFKATIEAVPGKISYDSRIKIGICKEEIAKLENEIEQNNKFLEETILRYNCSNPISLAQFGLANYIEILKSQNETKNNALRERIQEINYQISQFERE